MSFQEWLNERQYDKIRGENIQTFVGELKYPAVQEFLKLAYQVGYKAGKSDTEDLMGSG